ncbi:hypothetical protein GCM10022240_14990 [Microbacterium kribbense]|uniref:Uncharacterized protein n=1 Tax=Microbacterium kribbense TaxID=433645 RepID=A0ABP7GEC9_9MICO
MNPTPGWFRSEELEHASGGLTFAVPAQQRAEYQGDSLRHRDAAAKRRMQAIV